ncbi:DUF6339 family protein [Adlercreutzia muris]|uniref:DUF6339 family protein n=1 Tax=Adlercreutzia muris TaxID=1796610 RepID=UPI0013664B1C|nr:DUF6339 family protein [Adlercreutzia muris]MCI9494810.1 hypothetical protein [Adlercreutzia mucosicola]
MSDIRFRALSMTEAKRWAKDVDRFTDDEFSLQVECWKKHEVDLPDSSYAELRAIGLEAFERPGGASLPARKMYPIDVEVGLDVYDYLSRNGFTAVEASDDDIWRFISIKVFPDLTYLRYPDPEKETREQGGRINRKRFFSHTRRIWIKTLWWYVHLSWQGSVNATRAVLADNGANIISHFIETPGKGYRVDLYRTLMRYYADREDKGDKLFRSVAKLNGAECRNIEPALLPGGVAEYCHVLFSKVEEGGAEQ